MKTKSYNTLIFNRLPEKSGFLVTVSTLIVALVYMLSTNGFFIVFAEFEFNPSKLFVISILPFLLLTNIRIKREDVLFFMFIIFSLIKSTVFQDIKLLTHMSNFIIPFFFYLVVRNNLNRINLKLLVFIIVFWATLHAGFGILQFVTGNNELLLIEDTNEFKLKYASNYAFNPFETLELLPHGLYGYSSVLAISLVFPLFLLAGSRRFFSMPIIIVMFCVMALTIFLCFSRFEILSLLLLLTLGIFVVKDGKRIMFFKLLLIITVFFVLGLLYFLNTSDSIGSFSARLISTDFLITDFFSLVFGVPSIYGFFENYGFNIPHNMYYYSWLAYGFFAACFFSGYLWLKIFKYIKFYKQVSCLLKVELVDFTVYIYVLLFLLFLVCCRAFDYYIIDGYENILLFFYCFIILDKIISSHHKSVIFGEKKWTSAQPINSGI